MESCSGFVLLCVHWSWWKNHWGVCLGLEESLSETWWCNLTRLSQLSSCSHCSQWSDIMQLVLQTPVQDTNTLFCVSLFFAVLSLHMAGVWGKSVCSENPAHLSLFNPASLTLLTLRCTDVLLLSLLSFSHLLRPSNPLFPLFPSYLK